MHVRNSFSSLRDSSHPTDLFIFIFFFFALFLLLTTQRIKKTAINLLFHQGGYYKRMVKSTINQLTVVSLPWSHEGRLWVFQNKSIQFPKHPKKKKSWASKNGMVPMLTMFLKIAPSLYIYIYTYWVRYYYPGKLFMQKCQGNQQKDHRRQHKKKQKNKEKHPDPELIISFPTYILHRGPFLVYFSTLNR